MQKDQEATRQPEWKQMKVLRTRFLNTRENIKPNIRIECTPESAECTRAGLPVGERFRIRWLDEVSFRLHGEILKTKFFSIKTVAYLEILSSTRDDFLIDPPNMWAMFSMGIVYRKVLKWLLFRIFKGL